MSTDPLRLFQDTLASLLDQLEQAPNEPTASRWRGNARQRHAVELYRDAQHNVLDRLAASQNEVHANTRARLAGEAAEVCLGVAAVLVAADCPAEANTLVDALRRLDLPAETADLLRENPPLESIRALRHAWWLYRHKDFVRAAKAITSSGQSSTTGPFRELAAALGKRGAQVDRAPSLSTVNGIGTAMHGRRDVGPDGSYVSTLCFVVLFIPVFAIGAYRVRAVGDGYQFLEQVPLLRWQVWSRAALFVVALAAGGLSFLNDYLHSPGYLARVAVDAAHARMEHEPAEAAKVMWGVLRVSPPVAPDAVLAHAVELLLRLEAPDVSSGCSLASQHTLLALSSLVASWSRSPRLATGVHLAPALFECARELESQDAASPALVPLLTSAQELQDSTTVLSAQKALERISAVQLDRWTPTRPVAALDAALRTDQSTFPGSGSVARVLASQPLVLNEHAALVDAWLVRARKVPELAAVTSVVGDALARGKAQVETPGRAAALLDGDVTVARALLRETPWDQAAALVLAEDARAKEDSARAELLLKSAGGEGPWLSSAALLLPELLLDQGNLDKAEGALQAVVDEHLALHIWAHRQRARREHTVRDAAWRYLENAAVTLVGEEGLPTKDDASREAWVADHVARDSEHAFWLAREEASAHAVDAALRLGGLLLERAGTLPSGEREPVLRRAEAALLSIQHQLAGQRRYQLDLGLVQHRLGNAGAGDAAFQTLLDGDDQEAHLEVARAYRELGNDTRARELAKQVYRDASGEVQGSAATVLALLSDTREEEAEWFRRAPQDDPFVVTSILALDAERALETGSWGQADSNFAAAAKAHLQDGSRSSGLNNAALATGRRFLCTGNKAHLMEAGRLAEAAHKAAKNNSVVLGNTLDVLEHLQLVRALGAVVDVSGLRLSRNDAREVLDTLSGAEAERRHADVAKDPSSSKIVRLRRMWETLTPSEDRDRQRRWSAARELGLAAQEALRDDLRAHPITAHPVPAETEEHKKSREVSLRTRAAYLEEFLEQPRSAATAAVAHLLLARAYSSLWKRTGDLAHVRLAASHIRAAGAWGGLDVMENVAAATTHLAAAEGLAGTPALWTWWMQHARQDGLGPTIAALQREHPDAFALVRTRPELKQAAAALEKVKGLNCSVTWLVLARAAQNAPLAALCRPVMTDPRYRVELELQTLLDPSDTQLHAQWALLAAPLP